MRLKYDPEADVLYIVLSEKGAYEGEHLDSGVVVNYDENGDVVSIEILSLSKRFALKSVLSLSYEAPILTTTA